MASVNYAISYYSRDHGELTFLIRDAEHYECVEEAMPAIIDYTANNRVFRIEVVYFQGGLRRLGKTLPACPVQADTKIFLQIGTDNPVSLILWVDCLYEKATTSLNAKAHILASPNGDIVGIKVVIPN